MIIGVVAYLLGSESSKCECPSGGGRKGSSGFGSAMAGKIAGKVIDKVF